MKSLLSMVFEVGVPSKITKNKTNIIKKTNRYKFGDVNDTVSDMTNKLKIRRKDIYHLNSMLSSVKVVKL